jgi:hypothetical protein
MVSMASASDLLTTMVAPAEAASSSMALMKAFEKTMTGVF